MAGSSARDVSFTPTRTAGQDEWQPTHRSTRATESTCGHFGGLGNRTTALPRVPALPADQARLLPFLECGSGKATAAFVFPVSFVECGSALLCRFCFPVSSVECGSALLCRFCFSFLECGSGKATAAIDSLFDRFSDRSPELGHPVNLRAFLLRPAQLCSSKCGQAWPGDGRQPVSLVFCRLVGTHRHPGSGKDHLPS